MWKLTAYWLNYRLIIVHLMKCRRKHGCMNYLTSMLMVVHIQIAGTFTISNLGMFGVDRFDAILPPGTVRRNFHLLISIIIQCCLLHDLCYYLYCWKQGAIMAVGSSQPTLVGTKDGSIGIKNQMQVNLIIAVPHFLSHKPIMKFFFWLNFSPDQYILGQCYCWSSGYLRSWSCRFSANSFQDNWGSQGPYILDTSSNCFSLRQLR